jgi:hypothetical protein
MRVARDDPDFAVADLLVPSVLDARVRAGREPDLSATLAAALARTGADAAFTAAMTRPAWGVALHVPGERAEARLAHVAALRLGELAAGAGDGDALRLDTEAHSLLIAAAEARTPATHEEIGGIGQGWGQILLRSTSIAADAVGDLVLAADLGSWAASTAWRLSMYASDDPAALATAVTCLEAHAAVLRRTGEDDEADEALADAERLRDRRW